MDEDEEFECASVLNSHSQDVKCVKWHPHSDILASCGYDNAIKLYKEDSDDWSCFAAMSSHQSTVWRVDFDKTGTRLASCSDDKTVKVWQEYRPGNPEGIATEGSDPTWKCVCTLSGYHLRTVYDVQWSALTGHLATACGDDCIRVFEEEQSSERNQSSFSLLASVPKAHSQDINCVAWNPKVPGLLASCSDDAEVKLWKLNDL